MKIQKLISKEPPPALSAKQMKFIRILAEHPNIKAAADQAGIGRTTAHRWLQDPVFQEELARQRHQLINIAMSVVQSRTEKAAQTLIDLMDSDNEQMRRQACKDVLSYSLRIRAAEATEERLRILERKLSHL